MNRQAAHRAKAISIAQANDIPGKAVDIWHPVGTTGIFNFNDGTRKGTIDIYTGNVVFIEEDR